MNIYGCSVLRHLNGNVRCAASAAHENNVNGNVDGRPHDHTTQLTAHPEQANRAACASASIPATAHNPTALGRRSAAAGRAGVRGMRGVRGVMACVACVLRLRRRGALMAGGRLGAGCAPDSSAISTMILVSPSSGCEGAAVAATTCSCDASRLWGCGCWQERADHQSAAALAATGLVVEQGRTWQAPSS